MLTRSLIILLLSMCVSFGYSQESEPDSIKFSYAEVQKMANRVSVLQKRVQLQQELIQEFDFQARQDSIILANRELQIQNLNDELKLWQEKSKRGFFESETWGFIKGAFLIIGASWVVNNVQ